MLNINKESCKLVLVDVVTKVTLNINFEKFSIFQKLLRDTM